jgi:hypothetical protein
MSFISRRKKRVKKKGKGKDQIKASVVQCQALTQRDENSFGRISIVCKNAPALRKLHSILSGNHPAEPCRQSIK